MSLDEEGSRNFFQHIMSLWILPDIDRRKQNGLIGNDFILTHAQIIFDLDRKINKVRLNEEVKAVAEAKIRPGIRKEKGEPIYEYEVEEIKNVRLTDQDDINCGHVTMLIFKGEWIIHFDFRYNKGRAKERYVAAKEFHEAASLCYSQRIWRPFVDNMFSAIELLATSQLFLMPDQKYVKKPRHKTTQMKYNSMVKLGNYKVEYMEALNKLSGLRDDARYMKKPFIFTSEDATKLMQIESDMIKFTEDSLK